MATKISEHSSSSSDSTQFIAELSSSSSDSTQFKWVIKNFSKLNPKVGTESDVFSVGSFKWKALIQPKGDWRAHDHLSLFLCSVDLITSVDTKFRFTVTNQIDPGCLIDAVEITKTFTVGDFPSWGSIDFMHLRDLHDPDKGYIVNDTCVIKVEVTCKRNKETEDDANKGNQNNVTKTEKKKQAEERDDNKGCPLIGEYPGAGQPFDEESHNYKAGFINDKEFEDVGGFSILKTQAVLYRKIWLKYGHIPCTKVIPITSYSILVMVVKDFMSCIIDMHECHYVDLSCEIIERWEDMINMAEKLGFNIGWLRERFEIVKKGMGGMQNVRTELLEHGQSLRAAQENLNYLRGVVKRIEVQVIEAKGRVRENTHGLLSESDMEMYLEIGESLLLVGLF